MKVALTLFSIALLAASPAVPPRVGGLEGHADIDPGLGARVLVSELNCTACHAGDPSPAGAPLLDRAASRAHRDYLAAYIADPSKTKPGTTMPSMLGDLPEAERLAAAAAIADYLVSLSGPGPEFTRIDPAAADRGATLFKKVGCAACHEPGWVDLKAKYSVGSLTEFLKAPLASRPNGRMPDSKLTHFEATDLAHHLLRGQEAPPDTGRATSEPDRGRLLFEKHGCVQCHDPDNARRDFARPLADLDRSKPCPSAKLELSDKQKAHLAAPLATPTPAHHIELTLTQLNCIACHTRDGYGGVSPERDPYFTTSNLNLGEQARIPPSLTGVGAKLDPKWLRKVLFSGEPVRPYMDTRMPKFGPANVEHLLPLFAETDSLPPAPFQRVRDQKVAREAGHALVGTKNLACVACHTFKGETTTTLNGLELTSMAERLQETWFHSYMRNPQEFHPTTIMPNFWPAGKAVRPELLGGDPGQQIDAIWQYLERGREARTPHGIKREPIYYGPGDDGRAVVFRRQYRGIGKRGIGVGYASGINIAFDAAQLRLGSIWAGDFGEMSGVWRGQGSGSVNEQGRDVVRFPTGPAIARLPAPGSPWPGLPEQKRPEGYQFKGYTLDDKGRPTFRYAVGDIDVTETSVDQDGALTRTIAFDRPAPDDLYLLLGAPSYRTLTISAPPGAYQFESKELRLPLAGKTEVTLTYQFAPAK